MSVTAVIQFDAGAHSARAGQFQRAAQENGGGHSVQKAAARGGVDVSAINSAMQARVKATQKFLASMRAMQIQNPSGQYDQMLSQAQSVIREWKSRPSMARASQSNLLSQAGAGSALGG
jgi:hypothetical protein